MGSQSTRSPPRHSPLNTRQDRRDVVCRAPPVLQDVQAELPGGVHVRVEHLADELDLRRFVGVLFLELEDELEGAVFEGGVPRSDDDGVPTRAGQRECL